MVRQKNKFFLLIVMMASLIFLATPVFAETYSAHTVKRVLEEDSKSTKMVPMEVQLLRDYSPYGEPVSLTEENQWTYTWNKLSDEYNWTVEGVNLPLDGSEHKVDFDGTVVTMGAFEDIDEENFGGASVEKESISKGNGNIETVAYAIVSVVGVVILMIKIKEKRRGR